MTEKRCIEIPAKDMIPMLKIGLKKEFNDKLKNTQITVEITDVEWTESGLKVWIQNK